MGLGTSISRNGSHAASAISISRLCQHDSAGSHACSPQPDVKPLHWVHGVHEMNRPQQITLIASCGTLWADGINHLLVIKCWTHQLTVCRRTDHSRQYSTTPSQQPTAGRSWVGVDF